MWDIQIDVDGLADPLIPLPSVVASSPVTVRVTEWVAAGVAAFLTRNDFALTVLVTLCWGNGDSMMALLSDRLR